MSFGRYESIGDQGGRLVKPLLDPRLPAENVGSAADVCDLLCAWQFTEKPAPSER